MYTVDSVESNHWGFSYATIEEKKSLGDKCSLFSIFYLGNKCHNLCLKEITDIYKEPTLQICEVLNSPECWPRVHGNRFKFDFMTSGAAILAVSLFSFVPFILIYN